MSASIYALAAIDVDQDGNVTWSKAPDQEEHGRSTVKLLTCAVVRDIFPDLSMPLTVTSSDTTRAGHVNAGDVVSLGDLIVLALIESDARAILCMERYAISELATNQAGFLTFMETWAATTLGWTGHVITDSGGFGWDNRLTARGLVGLMQWVRLNDPWLFTAAGHLTYDLTITGARNTTVPIEHTATAWVPDPIPEFISGKTGSNGTLPTSDAFLVMAWRNPVDDSTHSLAVMSSTLQNRTADVRAILDDVIAATPLATRRRGAMAAI